MEKLNKQEKKDEFVELRIKGETFESIARRLSVSKQTLINWSKETGLKETIDTARQMRYQSILKTYEQDRQSKIEFFAELAQKVKAELLKRDLSELAIEKLFKLAIESDEKLTALTPTHEFGGGYMDFDILKCASFVFDPKN